MRAEPHGLTHDESYDNLGLACDVGESSKANDVPDFPFGLQCMGSIRGRPTSCTQLPCVHINRPTFISVMAGALLKKGFDQIRSKEFRQYLMR